MRTNDQKSERRLRMALSGVYDLAGVLNGLLGLAGESGELTDMFKKFIFHEAGLDVEHAKKELGDVLWYVALICESMGWNMDEIMNMNIRKLAERYPGGFDVELSGHRKEGDV